MSRYPQMKTTDPRFAQRVKDLQKVLGLVGAAVDGQFGHATLSLIEDKLLPPVQVSTPEVPKTPEPSPTPNAGVDARSARNILTLNPKVRHAFERLVIEGTRIARELGAESYVLISGNRTYAEQDALYAKGRTTTGPVVTNARAGYSNHNFGIAGDYGSFDKGGNYLDNTNPGLASRIHKAVAQWAKANLPIEWGGDWSSFRDEPHFQYVTGYSLSELRARVKNGEDIL